MQSSMRAGGLIALPTVTFRSVLIFDLISLLGCAAPSNLASGLPLS